MTFSILSNRSLSEIALRLDLIANIPASVATLLKSAPNYIIIKPVELGHNLANISNLIFFSILITLA